MRAIDAKHYWLEARLERREGWDGERYPFNLPAVRHTDAIVFHPKVTFFVGENGAGKSTLIEALAVAWGFNAEGGSKNFNFTNRASHSPLHHFVRPVRGRARPRDGYFLRAESYFNVATEIEKIHAAALELNASIKGGDYKLIRAAIERLDKATTRFAELMMDTAVSSALTGKTMGAAGDDLGTGPSAPHPFAPAQIDDSKQDGPAAKP